MSNRSVRDSFETTWKAERQQNELSNHATVFVTKLLNSPQLATKTTQLMKPILNLLMNPPSDATMEDIASKLASAIFAVKQSTALACWMDHIRPLEKDLRDTSGKYSNAKRMLHDARVAYLHEVTHLRDSAQCRRGTSTDIVWFFEPTQTLDEEEKKFVLDVVREKLRMVAENNPRIVQTWDIGQVDKLLAEVEGNELSKTRSLLKERDEELESLKRWLKIRAPRMLEDFIHARNSGYFQGPEEQAEHIVSSKLQEEVAELRKEKEDIANTLEKNEIVLRKERFKSQKELRSESAL